MNPGITIAIPAHPNRIANGMLGRAISSATHQERQPDALAVAIDQHRQGAPRTRQRALEQVRTEWVAFLDSDDYLWPNHLRVLERLAADTGADYVFSWFETDPPGLSPFRGSPEHATRPWTNDKPLQTTITVMVRTELALQVGFWDIQDEQKFPDGLRIGEDFVFTTGVMAAGGRIERTPELTWSYAMHGLNTSGRPDQGDAG